MGKRIAVAALLMLAAVAVGVAPAWTQATERLLIDVVVRVLPGAGDGHCILLDRGTLLVTLAPESAGSLEPVRFGIGGWRIDPSATLQVPLLPAPRTYETRVSGGLYCYSLAN